MMRTDWVAVLLIAVLAAVLVGHFALRQKRRSAADENFTGVYAFDANGHLVKLPRETVVPLDLTGQLPSGAAHFFNADGSVNTALAVRTPIHPPHGFAYRDADGEIREVP